jgi:translation initiation factor eIF-2B subunit delta
MGIDVLLRELREDRVHGASWYFLKGIEAVSLALSSGFGEDEIKALVNRLRSIRPGMASLANLAYIIDQALNRGFSINDVVSRLKEEYSKIQSRLVGQLNKHAIKCGSSAITISYSSAVKTALAQWGKCFESLFIMESRPGNEVSQAISDYSSLVNTIKPIPDSAIASFIKRGIDYAIVGADGLYADGYFLNKVGTETLLITARRFDVETIVIAESYKAATGGVGEVYTVSEVIGDMTIEVPLFDRVPFDLVDYLITDVDVIKRPRAKDIESLREAFINNVLNLGEQ